MAEDRRVRPPMVAGKDLSSARAFGEKGLNEASVGWRCGAATQRRWLGDRWAFGNQLRIYTSAANRDESRGHGCGKGGFRSSHQNGRASRVRCDRAALRARVSPVELSYAGEHPPH